MTPHVLDRPIWRALVGRQASLSVGDDRARRYLGRYQSARRGGR